MRADREPGPLWLQFKKVAGFMTMSEAEPFERSADEPRAHEVMADRIRELRGEVNGGISPADLADRLGCRATARHSRTPSGWWSKTGSGMRQATPRPGGPYKVGVGPIPYIGNDTDPTLRRAEELFDEYAGGEGEE